MLSYRSGAASASSVATSMAHYYQSSEKLPELQTALAAYYAPQISSPEAGALAMPWQGMSPIIAEKLEIDRSRPLHASELAHLLGGLTAQGNAIPGKKKAGGDRTNVTYFDFVLSAPKSLSVALLHASPSERAKLSAVNHKAVEWTVAHMETVIGTASVGKTAGNRARNREKGNFAAILVNHHTARPTLKVARGNDTELVQVAVAGDPHEHFHILVPNVTVSDSGRPTAIYQEGLSQRVHEIGTLYQAKLASLLREELGVRVEFDSTPGLSFNERMARLSDIPRDICDLYSKRSQDGLNAARGYAQSRGLDFDSLSPEERISLLKNGVENSKQSKKITAGEVNEYESWMQQARDANYKHRSVLRPGQEQTLRPATERHKQAYDVALPLINDQLERRAVLEGSVARVAAAKGLIEAGIASADEVNAITHAMRTEGVQQDGKMTSLHWAFDPAKRYARVTTQLSVEMEQEAIGLLRAAATDKSAAIPMDVIQRAVAKVVADAAAKGQTLDFTSPSGRDQLAFGTKLAQSGMAAAGVGWAGTGKSVSLRIPIEAGKMMGREHIGIAVAWRQTEGLKAAGVTRHGSKPARQWKAVNADALHDAGIESVFALSPFIKRVKEGRIKVGPQTTVVVDELGLAGTKQLWDLARLREKHGFQLLKIGDDAQCQPVEAGASVDLCRRAYGAENVPELSYNIRQTKHDAETSKLWREGKAGEALARKDEDGTLRIVPGGYADAIKATVDLWSERITANRNQPDFSLGISVPTNADGRAIGEAIRLRRRSAGEVGPDLLRLAACDQNGDTYTLAVAKGDRVRLFDRVRGRNSTGRVSIAGVNGTVVEVLNADRDGMDVRKPSGLVARIGWDALRKDNGPIRLTYGDAVTIDARQSDTVTEHITSMPSGSSSVNGFKAYTAESRHRVAAWLVTSQGAEKDEIQQRRPLGDPRNRETDAVKIKEAVLANMARNMSQQPTKTLAVDFMDRAVGLRSGTVDAEAASWHPRRGAETGVSARVEGSNNPRAVHNTPAVIEQRREDQAVVAAIAAMDEDRAALLRVADAVRDVILVPPPTPEETAIARRAALVAGGRMAYSDAIDDLMGRYFRVGGDVALVDQVEERYGIALANAAGAIDEGTDRASVTRILRDLPRVNQEQRDAARAVAPTPVTNSNLRQHLEVEQNRQIDNGLDH